MFVAQRVFCSFLFKQKGEEEKKETWYASDTQTHMENWEKKRTTSDLSTGSRRRRRAIKRENNNSGAGDLWSIGDLPARSLSMSKETSRNYCRVLYIWQISSSVMDESLCFVLLGICCLDGMMSLVLIITIDGTAGRWVTFIRIIDRTYSSSGLYLQ